MKHHVQSSNGTINTGRPHHNHSHNTNRRCHVNHLMVRNHSIHNRPLRLLANRHSRNHHKNTIQICTQPIQPLRLGNLPRSNRLWTRLLLPRITTNIHLRNSFAAARHLSRGCRLENHPEKTQPINHFLYFFNNSQPKPFQPR